MFRQCSIEEGSGIGGVEVVVVEVIEYQSIS
jgi:hypothetical protein